MLLFKLIGEFVDDNEDEDGTDFEFEEADKTTSFKKNPSNMSVRAAKRFWFSPRKSGRPSKELSDKLSEAKSVLLAAGEPLKRTLIRKNPKSIDGIKRPRGRPKKSPTLIKEKRPRGRPKKHPVLIDKPKRPKGRPRKHPIDDNNQKPLRPRGRPRKNPTNLSEGN